MIFPWLIFWSAFRFASMLFSLNGIIENREYFCGRLIKNKKNTKKMSQKWETNLRGRMNTSPVLFGSKNLIIQTNKLPIDNICTRCIRQDTHKHGTNNRSIHYHYQYQYHYHYHYYYPYYPSMSNENDSKVWPGQACNNCSHCSRAYVASTL